MLGRLSPHQTASVSKAVPVMILDASADIEINRRIWSTDLRDETARIERNAQRDDAVAPPETSRRRDIVDPEIEERLAIMTIDGELAEADARVMMRVAPT